MRFTKEQITERLCRTMGIVYHAHADYNAPDDGICETCQSRGLTFDSAGRSAQYIQRATEEALELEGLWPKDKEKTPWPYFRNRT